MIRELIHKLTTTLSGRNVPLRREYHAPVRVWFDPDAQTDHARELARSAAVSGETTDISRTGVGFVIPVIRVKEKYFAGQEHVVNAEIDLPGGSVYMRVVGCRYEKIGNDVSSERYMIGAHIVSIEGSNKELYETCLRHGRRRARGTERPVKIGID